MYTTGLTTSPGIPEPTNSSAGESRRGGQQPEPADPLGRHVAGQPLGALAPVIAELAGPGVADPLAQYEFEARRIAARRNVALGAGDAHDVADPSEVRVLHLQEVVVRELRDVAARDAGGGPVELHSQPLGERAVIEVLAVPRAAVGQVADADRREHHAQDDEDEGAGRLDVGVGDVGETGEQRARRGSREA